jgi:hypothetical protein
VVRTHNGKTHANPSWVFLLSVPRIIERRRAGSEREALRQADMAALRGRLKPREGGQDPGHTSWPSAAGSEDAAASPGALRARLKPRASEAPKEAPPEGGRGAPAGNQEGFPTGVNRWPVHFKVYILWEEPSLKTPPAPHPLHGLVERDRRVRRVDWCARRKPRASEAPKEATPRGDEVRNPSSTSTR